MRHYRGYFGRGPRPARRAEKGGECEQVTGATHTEALVHLEQLIKADRVMSAP